MLSHPCDKNKNVARMGHPISIAIDMGQITKKEPLKNRGARQNQFGGCRGGSQVESPLSFSTEKKARPWNGADAEASSEEGDPVG
jgi:hypothetical protein